MKLKSILIQIMLRIIRENKPETGLQLFGINFSDPLKKYPMTTLQQWENMKKTKSTALITSAKKIRYPTRMEMEIPTSVSFIADPGMVITHRSLIKSLVQKPLKT